MSSDDFAIRLENVSKHYAVFERPEHRLKQMVVPRLSRMIGREAGRYYRDFAALENVSFEVPRGQTVGIIGRNGSGKSTLLQIVCGTLNPSAGKVAVNGRIAALLELGAGFNPEFTGRENVYLNAAILGLKKSEVDERFDDIVRFADIGQFIDQPVKTYSSGMYVRLAFATAINVDPDILVVDEALAVGDEAFRRKCYARIEEIQEGGGTILFVSHGPQTIVQLCSTAILIDGGELILQGDPKTVTGQYQRLINVTGDDAAAIRAEIRAMDRPPLSPPVLEGTGPEHSSERPAAEPVHCPDHHEEPHSSQPQEFFDTRLISESRVEYERHGAGIRDLKLLDRDGRRVNILQMGERYTYEYVVDFDMDAKDVGLGMMINTVSGLSVGGIGTGVSSATRLKEVKLGASVRVRLDFDARLLPGTYFVNAGVTGTNGTMNGYLHRILDGIAFRVAPVKNLTATGIVDFNISARTGPEQDGG